MHAIVKASTEVLGIVSTWVDWGIECKGRVWADATAALGIVSRRGLGKVRHLDTSLLWVQEASLRKKILYSKVAGEFNIADLMTKHLDAETTFKHCTALGMEFKDKPSVIALSINSLCRGPFTVSADTEIGKVAGVVDGASSATSRSWWRYNTTIEAEGEYWGTVRSVAILAQVIKSNPKTQKPLVPSLLLAAQHGSGAVG